MRRTKLSGLQIRRTADRSASERWLLPVLSGSVIYAMAALTGLAQPWLPALVGVAVCGASLLLGKRMCYWCGIIAALLLCRSSFQDGFCQWYNLLGRIITAEKGIVLPALEASADLRNLRIFTCWLAAAVSVGMVFLSKLGKEAVGTSVILLCGGVCLASGGMIDPLPLILAAAMLCSGRGWKQHLLPMGILSAAVLLALVPGFSDWAGEQSEGVLRAVHAARYETKYTTLPEGRLEPLRRSDQAALIVTMEKPEVLYLRGFTGVRFSGDRWLPMDNRILEENRELLYWLNCREFDPRAQFEAAASGPDTGKNTVTVQNVGACSAYRYIPFTICVDDRLIAEDLTETAKGGPYDSFATVCGGAAMLPEVLTALEQENSRYLQAEAAYRAFVEAHYLTVPEELAGKMQPYWDEAEGLEAQAAVKTVLGRCFPDGMRGEPYDATAAVLTLRHFGIPARYAEGYILPQTTAATVELTGRHAACWAEVYQDGIGWVPMALTPGLDGEPQQQEEQPLPPDTPEETPPPQTEPIAEPEPNGGYQVRVARIFISGAILVIGLLILAAMVLILRRKYILRKRQDILNQEDLREAVTWSFASSIRFLERMGIHRGNGSADALIAPIRQRFGPELAEGFEAASRVNARALFSSKPMTETERAVVNGFRDGILSRLREDSGRLSRLWMKYILCVF